MMRALGNSARAGIIILGLYLMGILVDASRWDAPIIEMTSPTARFADVLMVDWSLALVVLGALLSMAMIGASYLVRDERLENLVWNESDIEVASAPSKRGFSPKAMDKVSGNELALLANYLAEKGQTVFQFFRSIDLDDSGEVDTMEFQIALSKAKIANLPPWDIDALVSQMDLNGDGKLDLPELDIALLSLEAAKPEEEAEEEPEIAEEDVDIEVETQPKQAEEEAAEDQARMDKELEERRKRLENLDEKARKKEEELIRVAEKAKTIDFGTLGVAASSKLKKKVEKGTKDLEVADASRFDDKGEAYISDTDGGSRISWTGKAGNRLTGVKGIKRGFAAAAVLTVADDLQRINGIGPFIEDKLNALGIYTFDQVGKMTPELEETVNVAIEFFPGRVKRDEWAKQARNFVKNR